MARIRYIKPEFFDDPVLAGCSHPARLLFVALWQIADRSGVFDPDRRKLKKYAFGYDVISPDDVGGMLTELVAIGAVYLDQIDGKELGLIVNLKKHQKFHKDEVAHLEHLASTLEARCKQGGSTLEARCKQGGSTLVAGLVTGNGERVTETGNGITQQPAGTAADSPVSLKPVDTESRARPTKPMEPLVLAEWDRLRKEFNRPGPDSYDANHHRAAGAIYASYAKDSRWQKLLRKFAIDAFYQNVGWSLVWLAKNSAQVAGREAPAAKVDPREKRQVVPNAAESQARLLAMQQVKPASQAVALAAISELKTKFGMV